MSGSKFQISKYATNEFPTHGWTGHRKRKRVSNNQPFVSIVEICPLDYSFDDAFRGREGIIAFSVNWQGDTGHIALWNGVTYREPSHDNYSTYVNSAYPNIGTSRGEFWEIA